MKYKKAIIFSTIMIFVVAAAVALGWLFRARYFIVNDLNGLTGETAESGLYSFVCETLEKKYKGKWLFSFGEKEIENDLSANPYVELIEVKKTAPDKISVTFSERKERFLIVIGDKGYVTDSGYNLLRDVAATDFGEQEDSLVRVEVRGMDELDFSALPKGKKITFEEENLFGAMTDIFGKFSDKLNFISGITIDGEKNIVEYRAQTGVIIDVSLAVATADKPTEADKKATRERICESVAEIESVYNNLDERSKRRGYIRVYETDEKEVIVNYEPDGNVNREEKND